MPYQFFDDLINTLDKPFYKRKNFIIITGAASIALVMIIIIIVIACSGEEIILTPPKESTEGVINPDQGITSYVTCTMNETGINKYWLAPKAEQMHDIRCDISAFSKINNGKKDLELTQAALDGLEKLMKDLRTKDQNCVIRFAYDPKIGGNPDRECEMSMILKHIRQLGKVLNKYSDVITAIQASMVGKWGEMHSSIIVTPENIKAILNEWLTVTNKIPILVRYPKYVYQFFNYSSIDEIQNITIKPEQKGYYLGIWNDYLWGNSQEGGTWKNWPILTRDQDVAWFKRQNDHLPYGGETEWNKESEYNNLNKTIPELFISHLSFFRHNKKEPLYVLGNQTYKASIAGHKIFEGKNGYEFIYAHLGYRLVMTKIIINVDNLEFDLKIDLINNGFSFVNKIKNIGLVYSYDNSTIIKEENNLGKFYGKQNNINIKGNLIKEPKDKYYVYLRLYHNIDENGFVHYSIKFANENTYNKILFGNFLFAIDKENKNIYN